jgi:hypothetical protein
MQESQPSPVIDKMQPCSLQSRYLFFFPQYTQTETADISIQ